MMPSQLPVRGRGVAMGSQIPPVPDWPYRWCGVPGWDPARLGPMITQDSQVATTPGGLGPSAALEVPRAAVPDAAHPKGGRRGTSRRDVARGEAVGPVATGPAVKSPPEPTPLGSRGATEGEPAPPRRTPGVGSPTDTDPAGGTRSSTVLPAAGRC